MINLSKHITENKLLWGLIVLLLLSTLLDIYTAYSSPIFELAETNPIYVITGSKAPLLIANVVVLIWIARNLTRSVSIFKIFVFSLAAIYLSTGHLVGAYANITSTNEYNENPEKVMAQIEQYSVKDKFTAYTWIVGLAILLPILLSITAFSIAMFFFNKRKSQREKVIDEIYKLTFRLRAK